MRACLFLYTKTHNAAGVYSGNKGWKLLQAVKGFGPKVEGAIYFLLAAQHLPFDSTTPSLSSPPSYSLPLSFSTAHCNEAQLEIPFKEGKKGRLWVVQMGWKCVPSTQERLLQFILRKLSGVFFFFSLWIHGAHTHSLYLVVYKSQSHKWRLLWLLESILDSNRESLLFHWKGFLPSYSILSLGWVKHYKGTDCTWKKQAKKKKEAQDFSFKFKFHMKIYSFPCMHFHSQNSVCKKKRKAIGVILP